jgi:iron complex outermembrane receptor protein
MASASRVCCEIIAIALAFSPSAALAQSRSDENAVTQAEDAFGFSVGRESLGIYNAGNARGFSPTAAGNLRIDGLYFDQIASLQGTLLDSSNIKVGISAQGYPFAAPSGIADYTLRRPSDRAGASIVVNGDSRRTRGIELDGSLPVSSTLSVGYGINATHFEFGDGTNNFNHSETLIARWHPAPGIEIMPFWSIWNDFNDESSFVYLPAGDFLPVMSGPRRYNGPPWADFRFTQTNEGVLAAAALSANWQLRFGLFRSINDEKHGFADLILDEQRDGTGDRVLLADPPTQLASTSGELRLTHGIADGARLHIIHMSVRMRNARREFGGSAAADFGIGSVFDKMNFPEPDFKFGELSHDHVTDLTAGIAYDGRWKNVGEVSFGISRANFRKETFIPETPLAVTRSSPWLYNGTAAASLTKSITIYAGYARGLEESGTAPPNAANRNQPLPAVITQQKDAGIRIALGANLKAVAGVFDLSRPAFAFDAANIFKQIGVIRSRGAEFSISGNLTRKLNIVAGGVLLDPVVTRDPTAQGNIGRRPAGLPTHLLSLNLNWKTPIDPRLQLDAAVTHFGRIPATTDNLVYIPPRARVDIGGHYGFRVANRNATLRLQVTNLFNNPGYGFQGPGAYGQPGGRLLQGYMTVDF